MKCSTLATTALAALLSSGCADITRSRDLANPEVPASTLARQVCSNCHGVTGNSTSPNFPNLAGQVPAYTAAQLDGFRNHRRHDPAGYEYMWGLSRHLTDEQIQGLAAYFAAQKPIRQPLEGLAQQMDAGRAIFDNGLPAKGVPACASCHGPQGQGNEPFPRLAGQHADYLVKQLIVFQRTDQRPAGVLMKTVSHDLSRQEIDDVAAYVQSMTR